jgi:malate dehydrogenase (oxaloacetate-decarboxylating)
MNSMKDEIAEITNENNVQGSLDDVIVGAHLFIGVSVAGVLS